MSEVLYTSAAVADLISQLDEFKGKVVHITDTPDGAEIRIDEAVYNIPYRDAEDIEVDEAAMDEVTDVLDEAYSAFDNEDVLIDGVGAANIDTQEDILY